MDKQIKIENFVYANKRITREYAELCKLYSNIDVFYNYSSHLITFVIHINKNGVYNEYKFIISGEKYPFIPPSIYYNKIPYMTFLKLSDRFSTSLKTLTNKLCLCCSSFCCKTNWSPSVTMQYIITEINNNRQYIKNIVLNILIEQIKYRYLIDDIDIRSYLM